MNTLVNWLIETSLTSLIH